MVLRHHSRAQRWAIGFLAIFVLSLALLAVASAQTVTAEATVSWNLPTENTLGEPLEGDDALKKIQLFVHTSPIPDDPQGLTPIDLPPGSTTYDYEQTVPNGSTLYFRARACNDTCSSLSADTPQSRKQVRVSVPNVPTGVTVTLRVNLSSE